jgi:hypothetical protein
VSPPGKKARAQPAVAPPGVASRFTVRRVAAVAVTLAAAVGILWGIARLGELAQNAIGDRDRYRVPFADIDCNPPAGLDRPSFLAEVRYCSGFPEHFQLLAPDLTPRLTATFRSHPWVAAVERISVEPEGRVRVHLTYRTPVLSVRTLDGVRVVDAAAVLLPLAANPNGLPELATPVPLPDVAAGQVWEDETVKRAVQLVELYHPITLTRTGTTWRLTLADGKIAAVDR